MVLARLSNGNFLLNSLKPAFTHKEVPFHSKIYLKRVFVFNFGSNRTTSFNMVTGASDVTMLTKRNVFLTNKIWIAYNVHMYDT